jgi:hypothetical protein
MNIGIGIGLFGSASGESGAPPTGQWILITGLWDDAGEWDDADTWNDGA